MGPRYQAQDPPGSPMTAALLTLAALSAIHGVPDTSWGRTLGALRGVVMLTLAVIAGYERAQNRA